MQEMLFQRPNFKHFLGDMPPALTPLANSRLRYSAHTFGDRMRIYYAGGGQEKWALWQFFPTTEESLKNALTQSV